MKSRLRVRLVTEHELAAGFVHGPCWPPHTWCRYVTNVVLARNVRRSVCKLGSPFRIPMVTVSPAASLASYVHVLGAGNVAAVAAL